MTASLPRLLLTAALCAGLVSGIAGCGRKGTTKPPDGQESQYTYPQPYPAPSTVQPEGEPGSRDSGPMSIFNSGNRTKTKSY